MTWHLTLATEGRRPLATDRETEVRLLRRLGAIAGPTLLLFHLVDDHAHVVLETDRGDAGRRARRIRQAWQHARGASLEPTHFRPVEDRAHLLGLVEYVLRQNVRHGVVEHPAVASGSCFWDLVGLRVLPGFQPGALRIALPRLSDARIWGSVGLVGPPARLEAQALVGGLGLDGLLDVSGDALACEPLGRSREAVLARAVAARLAAPAGFRPEAAARVFGRGERSTRRLLEMPVPETAVNAVMGLAALRLEVRGLPPVDPTEAERRSLDRARVVAGAGAW